MHKNVIRILMLLSIGFALYGCGTKGPLYIPEQEYPQATQATNNVISLIFFDKPHCEHLYT